MKQHSVYEQPLNERVRTFLRIEKSFDRFNHHVSSSSRWDSHIAITSILDILGFATRGDMKLEIVKALERQNHKLRQLANRKDIDHVQLNFVLDKQRTCIEQLKSTGGNFSKAMQSNEFILSIKQRTSIPGPICDFDLPQLSHWLNTSDSYRKTTLDNWMMPFRILEESIRMILEVLRNGTNPILVIAENGFYQQPLDTNQTHQLIRVSLDEDAEYYPEISAGKHRYSVRFFSHENLAIRAHQAKEDISFELAVCTI